MSGLWGKVNDSNAGIISTERHVQIIAFSYRGCRMFWTFLFKVFQSVVRDANFHEAVKQGCVLVSGNQVITLRQYGVI